MTDASLNGYADPAPALSMPTTWAPTDAEEPKGGNPLGAVFRAMRGRWRLWALLSVGLSGGLGTLGFLSGTEVFESQAILRVYPRESSILYTSSDDSVLKTFDSFVRAETAFVASPDIMNAATNDLRIGFPDITTDMHSNDLRASIDIKRSNSLIVLTTKSKSAAFAAAKLEAVTDAYLDAILSRRDRQTDNQKAELVRREAELLDKLQELDRRRLDVGREFGATAIVKAHVEKITQIDALATRQAEVMRTLETMRKSGGPASADMNDEHILRATLLDRGLADLNIEIARREAELATLLLRYTERSRIVKDKKHQIEVLQAAQQDRREQIQVLGQTGALTDQSDRGEEQSLAAIEALLAKVTGELQTAREEARALNARRVELTFLEEERDETRRLLDDTREALDRIRIESRQASPGLVDLMSRPMVPSEPVDDNSKMLAAMGVAGGVFLATLMVLGAGLTSKRLEWSDALGPTDGDVPLLATVSRDEISQPGLFASAMDRLRTTLQLQPGHSGPRALSGACLCLAVLRASPGDAMELAQGIASSFARTRMRVLLVDADQAAPASRTPGWRDLGDLDGIAAERTGGLEVLPAGRAADPDRALSLPTLRGRIAALSSSYDLIVLHGGSLRGGSDARLICNAAHFAIAELRPCDRKRDAKASLACLQTHPQEGAGLVFAAAHPDDPSLKP